MEAFSGYWPFVCVWGGGGGGGDWGIRRLPVDSPYKGPAARIFDVDDFLWC